MTKDIKTTLLNEIDSLLSGKSDVKRANAIAKLSAQVIYKDRLDVEKEVLDKKVKLVWSRK